MRVRVERWDPWLQLGCADRAGEGLGSVPHRHRQKQGRRRATTITDASASCCQG